MRARQTPKVLTPDRRPLNPRLASTDNRRPATGNCPLATDAKEGCAAPCERCCERCVYAGLVEGLEGVLVCVNHPEAQGKMKRVWPSGGCRSFRARRETPGQVADEIRYLALTKGRFAIVDVGDYERLSRHKWSLVGHGDKLYAQRTSEGRHILMHREIMQPPEGMLVDHSDGNGLNNHRASLRVCTAQENQQNRRPKRGASSQFKGVWHEPRSDKWVAGMRVDGQPLRLGTFDNEIEAARAYDRQAIEAFGKFAYLNFPEDHEAINSSRLPTAQSRPPPQSQGLSRRQER